MSKKPTGAFLNLCALCLLVLCVGLLKAQSQNPTPAPRKQTSPQKKTTVSAQRGTEKSPIFVKTIPTPKTDEEAARDAKEHDEKAANEHRMVEFTGDLALLTAILAGIGVLQLLVFGMQAYELKQTVEATAASVKLQEVGMQQWVSIQNWQATPLKNFEGALNLNIQFDIVNPTKLPLTFISASIKISAMQKTIKKRFTLPPEVGRYCVETIIDLTEEQLGKWTGTGLMYPIHGSVDFESALGKGESQPFDGLLFCSDQIVVLHPFHGAGLYLTPKKTAEEN